MRLLLLLAFLFSFFIASAQSSESFEQYWLKLLHYHHGHSRADGEHFFLSKLGASDPKAELQATILAFKNKKMLVGWNKYHPQCVFRERYRFLKEAGLLNDVEEMSCPDFMEWKKGLNAESVTLVFLSSYANDPRTFFGSNLIRFNQKDSSDDLLDYGFDIHRGLIRLTNFLQLVSTQPHSHARDLFEYELNLSEAELERLINHLWEIYQTTYFNYLLPNENHSVLLADILMVGGDSRWYYLPSDLIKYFKKSPSSIAGEIFIPSLKKQLENSLNKLTKVELLETRIFTETASELPYNYDQLPVVNAIIALLEYNRYRTKDHLTLDQEVLLRRALLRKAALTAEGAEGPVVLYDQSNAPELSQGPQQLSIYLRTEDAHTLVGIDLKALHHGLMSNDFGYESFAQLDLLSASLVYDKNIKRLSYDQLTLIDAFSPHAYKFYDPQFAWAAKVTADRIYDIDCELCHRLNARAYLGSSLRPTPNMALSLLGGAFSEVAKHYQKGFRAGLGVEAGALFQVTQKIKLGVFNELRTDAAHRLQKDFYNQANLKVSYFSDLNTEWRVESSVVSKFSSFDNNRAINQIIYGRSF